MDRYMIETLHTAQDCQRLVDEIRAMGYLRNFDWGCDSDVHTGWAIIEAESEAEARLVVPPLVRGKARVIKLNKFSANEIRSLHET